MKVNSRKSLISRFEASAVEVRHTDKSGETRRLADRVRLRDGVIGKTRGLIGSRPLCDGEAMVFRFRRASSRNVHTLFVRDPLDVLWAETETVTHVSTMSPWSLGESAEADTIIELPAGTASSVRAGSIVRLARRDEQD